MAMDTSSSARTTDLLQLLQRLRLPQDAQAVLARAPSIRWFDTVDELLDVAVGETASAEMTVRFDLPDGRSVVEARVMRLRNGINVQYPEPYMRRRDPDCMLIADDAPTNKVRFRDRFGYEFSALRAATLDWLGQQPLAAFAFKAGHRSVGIDSIAIVPANCGFFAAGLAMLQGITPRDPAWPPRAATPTRASSNRRAWAARASAPIGPSRLDGVSTKQTSC